MDDREMAHVNLVEAALSYVRRALPVFPVWPAVPFEGAYVCACGRDGCDNPGKHPMSRLAPNGHKNATLNEDRVRRWWGVMPDANIGIATGRDYVVLDVDPRNGGGETLAELEKKHGPLPKTWRVISGGGGFHLYFAAHIPVRCCQPGPGLEIKGDGGSIVAPPSLHVSGNRYAWDVPPDGTRPALLPPWLRPSTVKSRSAGPASDYAVLLRDGADDGCRHAALLRLVGHYRRDVDHTELIEWMLLWNRQRCRPPLPEIEVVRVVESLTVRRETEQFR
jgi:hypothetical protein